MFRFLAVALLVACCSGGAVADTAVAETAKRTGRTVADVQQYLERCDESQSSMNLCAEYGFVKADIELSEVYRQLVARRDERKTVALRRAQSAWINLRDRNCEYESSDLEGGSLRAAVSLECKRRMTRDRAEWVRDMLSCTSVRGECRSSKPAVR